MPEAGGRFQNKSFRANWMIRGGPAVVTFPEGGSADSSPTRARLAEERSIHEIEELRSELKVHAFT